MREIKFNAWNKNTNAMHYDILSKEKWSFSFLDKDVFTWLQYLGLNDKNGKEIYEGDILKYYAGLPPTLELVHVVSYYVDGFKISNPKKTTKKNYLNQEIINVPKNSNYNTWNRSEIVGNIYENPTLL